jgi:N-acetylglucosaminyldiphosphoundecaprenol N-acetyl-beta-D-mannosaminyltransferase
MRTSTEKILGFSVESRSVVECVENMVDRIKTADRFSWFSCLNPHAYAVSLKDPLFSSALRDSNWLVPDGVGVVLASRVLNGDIRERVTGSDIFIGVQNALDRMGGYSVFFLGASDRTLGIIRKKMKRDYPGLRVAGTFSPPFKATYTEEELDLMISRINDAEPDVLWVGMTAPKQEKWIFQNRHRLNVKFAGALGAVFDFYAGEVQRAHPFFRELGLEWLVRLVHEPRRLWRRYFISGPIFLWHLLLAKFFAPRDGTRR